MKILEEALAKYIENSSSKPYAFLCNEETYKKIKKEFTDVLRLPCAPPNPYQKLGINQLSFGEIPIFKSETCPKGKVYVVDKETYLKIKKDKFFWEELNEQ